MRIGSTFGVTVARLTGVLNVAKSSVGCLFLVVTGSVSAAGLYYVPNDIEWSCTTSVADEAAAGLLGTGVMTEVCTGVPVKWSQGITASYNDGVVGGMEYETQAGYEVSHYFAEKDDGAARDWLASFVMNSTVSTSDRSAWIVEYLGIERDTARTGHETASRWLEQNSDDPRAGRIRQALEDRSGRGTIPEPGTAVLVLPVMLLAFRRKRLI